MSRKIRAAVFTAESGKHCEILDVILASPCSNEVIIKVKACGICHTDIAVAEYQKRPAVLGHEAAGEVVEVGSMVSDFNVGDRVVATFSSCGKCGTCCEQNPAYCMSMTKRNFSGSRPNGQPSMSFEDGTPIFSAFFQQSGFADHILVQEDNIVKIVDELSFEVAAPLGCGIQTGVGSILQSLDIQPQESLVIFGAGTVGLTAIMAAKTRKCYPIIAVDLDDSRLSLAKNFGAHHTLSGNDPDILSKIRQITDGGAHYTLEGTGIESVFHIAVKCLRPAGTCGTLGYPGTYGEFINYPENEAFMLTRHIGIVEGDSIPKEFIPKLAQMQLSGTLPYESLIKTFRFEDINDALDACADKSSIKPVLIFD